MKLLKRIFRKYYAKLSRGLRRATPRVSPAGALLIAEVIIACLASLLVLTGSGARLVDNFGGRADLAAIAAIATSIVVLHFFINRRVVPALDRRFSPGTYDERRILFDLGQAARAVTSVEELYRLVANKVQDALHVENVSVFVRDDWTGDYRCRVSVSSSGPEKTSEFEEGEHDSHEEVLGRDAFVIRRLANMGAPLGLEPRDLETWMRALAAAPQAARERRRQECRTLQLIKSRLLLGITMHERLVGVLSLGPRRGAHRFSDQDKRMLMSVASQLAFMIENAKLVERLVAEEAMKRELGLARQVQQRLFPADPPATLSLELSGFCQPAREVGGDYYDFLPLDDQIGVAVADVAGKGISAALLMSMVHAHLRSQAMARLERTEGVGAVAANGDSLADMVARLNRLLWGSTPDSSYVTFFYAQYNERTQALTYVNAGHNPPLLVRAQSEAPARVGRAGAVARQHTAYDAASGHVPDDNNNTSCALTCLDGESIDATAPREDVQGSADAMTDGGGDVPRSDSYSLKELTTGGPVIGVFEHCHYEQETIQLESGDLLVAYTDGLTESLNTEGVEFGEARLQDTLKSVGHLPADDVRACLIEQVRAWSEGAPQHDDLTFVVLRVK